MNYANIKYNDIANGDGVRTSLFVSGCRNYCKGCFNKIAWDFNYGEEFTQSILNDILKSLEPYYISGLSILGGEPLDARNIDTVTTILKETKNKYPNKILWVYTGYTWEELLNRDKSDIHTILALRHIDVLVDGKFDEDLYGISLKFRGSSNQRIIDTQKSLKENKVILYKE